MKKVFLTLALAIASVGASLAQDTITLSEAVITATRASVKTPVAQTTITKDEIRKNNIGADVPYIMNMAPSVVISSESGLGLGNTSFRIRGTDASRTNVTIDGVPINDTESQSVFWVNMPDFASSVNSIQIQRGVGTSSNGGAAFGASVNMETTRPSLKPYAELSTSVGMYNTFHSNINVGTGVLGNGFTVDARYSNVQSDGYINRSWAKHQSLYGAAAWQGENTFVKLSILYGEQHTGLSWSGVPGYAIDSVKYPYWSAGVEGHKPGINRRYNPAGEYRDNNGNIKYYDNQSDNYEQTHYHLQFSQQLAERWRAHTTLHLTRGLGYYEEYKLNRKYSEYGLPEFVVNGDTLRKKTDLIRQKWMDNYFYGLTFSVNYISNKVQWIIGGAANRHDGDHYGKVIWVKHNPGSDLSNEWYRNNGTKTDYNIYTKLNWQPNSLINIYGDLQYRHIAYAMDGVDDDYTELNQSNYFNFFNPKAGVFFNINKNQSAYASFSVSNREPTRTDFKDAAVNKLGSSSETPKAERLYDVELAYKFINANANIGINLYYMYYKNQLVSTGKLSSIGYPIMDNVEKSYRVGIELSGGVRIIQPLRFDANITLSRNKIKDFVAYTLQDWGASPTRVENLGKTNISFSPEIVGSAMLTYTPIKNLSFLLTAKYVDEQYYDNTSSADRKLNAYFANNFRIDYAFKLYGINLGLQGLINNVFNKQYISSAWVYRAVYSDGSPDYIENGFFPQAGRNVMMKLTMSF